MVVSRPQNTFRCHICSSQSANNYILKIYCEHLQIHRRSVKCSNIVLTMMHHTEKFDRNPTIINNNWVKVASFSSNDYYLRNKILVTHRVEYRMDFAYIHDKLCINETILYQNIITSKVNETLHTCSAKLPVSDLLWVLFALSLFFFYPLFMLL